MTCFTGGAGHLREVLLSETPSGLCPRCPARPPVFAYKGDWGGETEVIFELTPAGNDVILAITQTKLDEASKKAAYGSGWHAYLDALEDRLRNVKPRGFWTNFAKRQAEYAELFS